MPRRTGSRDASGHRRRDRFDERDINGNFDYDYEAYGEVTRNLGRLSTSGQLRLAMQLALKLMNGVLAARSAKKSCSPRARLGGRPKACGWQRLCPRLEYGLLAESKRARWPLVRRAAGSPWPPGGDRAGLKGLSRDEAHPVVLEHRRAPGDHLGSQASRTS